eukprot:scaffold134716_cov31-Tisochrysis_lutea.AAC.3
MRTKRRVSSSEQKPQSLRAPSLPASSSSLAAATPRASFSASPTKATSRDASVCPSARTKRNRSSSTALLDGAQTITLGPVGVPSSRPRTSRDRGADGREGRVPAPGALVDARLSRRPTNNRVLPVPGGPCTRLSPSPCASISCIARHWELFRPDVCAAKAVDASRPL